MRVCESAPLSLFGFRVRVRVVHLKNNWKFDEFLLVKNYLKESLLSIFCFIIQGKRSSEKGLILNSGKKFI